MPDNTKLTWQDIVPEDYLPFAKPLINNLVEEVVSKPRGFLSDAAWETYADIGYPSWVNHYSKSLHQRLAESLSRSFRFDSISLPKEDLTRMRTIELLQLASDSARPTYPPALREFAAIQDFEFVNIELILSFYAWLNWVICTARFGKTVPDLMEEASYDSDALFKLISLDPILIESKLAQQRIHMAALEGNRAFFQRLGKAIRSYNPEAKLAKHKDDLKIMFAWELGFSRVGLEQFSFFLFEVGFKRFSETSSLRRKLNRLGISTRQFSDTEI